jgi:ABC-type ATPase with predicted acetyltransferase domain
MVGILAPEVISVATWKCGKCGTEKDGRCKPKKCDCGGTTFTKKE